jgi:hypothetical protein
MRYILSMSSEEFGSEDFGPYDTMVDALLAQKSILAKAGQLKDGVERFFAIGLADDEQLPESISDDGSIAIQNPPENFDHDPRFDEGGEFHKEANPTTSLKELEITLGGIRHILDSEDYGSTEEMISNAKDLLDDACAALAELKKQQKETK